MANDSRAIALRGVGFGSTVHCLDGFGELKVVSKIVPFPGRKAVIPEEELRVARIVKEERVATLTGEERKRLFDDD